MEFSLNQKFLNRIKVDSIMFTAARESQVIERSEFMGEDISLHAALVVCVLIS